MSDLIKRADAIKAVENVSENYTKEGDREWHPHIDFITQALEEVPSADRPNGEWIPCSERLPTKEEQDDELGVLVTLGNGYSGLQFDYYYNGLWDDWNGCVIAWMPLPEPWKGADDE